MKTLPRLTASLATLVLSISLAQATLYTGSGVANGSGANDGGAISSVSVNNTASTITFTINSTMPMASYVFFAVELHYGLGGDTSLMNPWGPHVGIGTGVNALINTYGTGASALTYNGIWNQNASGNFDAGGTGSSFATMTFSLSSLGLSVGSTFNFDVVSSYTSPGGQAAYSALANTGYLPESDNSYQPWLGSNFYDSAASSGSTFSSTLYTVAAVPEPGMGALFALVGLVLYRRVSRRSA